MSGAQDSRRWHRDRFIPRESYAKVQCIACGRDMWLPPSKAGKYKTCGDTCRSKLLEENRQSKKRQCMTCGGEFYPRATQIKSGIGLYCSQKCNIHSHASMNTVDAQKKARAEWSKRHNARPFTKRGEDHPLWSGGRRARYLRQKEAGSYRTYNRDRRKRMVGKLPPGTVERIGAAQKWRCAACGKNVKSKFELDHIIPLSRGGEHSPGNVQILCMPCNRSKAAKDPIKFMQEKGWLL